MRFINDSKVIKSIDESKAMFVEFLTTFSFEVNQIFMEVKNKCNKTDLLFLPGQLKPLQVQLHPLRQATNVFKKTLF